MGAFTTGVALVTTRNNGIDLGMTVNSLTSVSLDPPLALVCLANGTRTLEGVRGRGQFAVSILGRHQRAMSRHFTLPLADRFAGLPFERDDAGVLVPVGRAGMLRCELSSVFPGGDHTIVVGRVTHVERDGDVWPLVFYSGGYTQLVEDV